MRWYKDNVRRDEVKLLMKGLAVPEPQLLSKEQLTPARTRPSSPPTSLAESHVYEESEDTSGEAQRRTLDQRTSQPSPQQIGEVPMEVLPPTPSTSRTTDWRRRKAIAEGSGPATKAPRKVYACRVCNQPMATEGHTQYKGRRYCPNAPGQIPKEEWLAQRKAEDKSKQEERSASH